MEYQLRLGVTAGKSRLPDGRQHCVIPYGMWFPVAVWWFPRTAISTLFYLLLTHGHSPTQHELSMQNEDWMTVPRSILVVAWLFTSRRPRRSRPIWSNRKQQYTNSLTTDVRKYAFSNRITNIWNSLPDEIISAPTVNTFKNRLDRFWVEQEVLYNYKANITGNKGVNL